MTEISNIGNLPKHLQIMAKEVQGQRSTYFYECVSAHELIGLASDGKCEETSVTMDKSTNRGFMVAFGFRDSAITDAVGDQLVVMNIYFTELTSAETVEYRQMLHSHRQQQETAHTKWKNKGQDNA